MSNEFMVIPPEEGCAATPQVLPRGCDGAGARHVGRLGGFGFRVMGFRVQGLGFRVRV